MMGLLASIGKGITKALDVTTVAIARPVQTATAIVSKKSTVQDVINKQFSQSVPKQISSIALGTVGIAATVIGGAAIGGAAKAGTLAPKVATVAKALIPSTVKGKVAATVAIPLVAGAVAQQPVKTISTISKAPGELAQFGGDLANLAADPSLENAKQLVKESPIISAAAATGALFTIGKTAIPAVSGLLQREAIKDQTKALEEVIKSNVSPEVPAVAKSSPNKADPIPAQIPITPETKPLVATAGSGGSSTSKKRKKRVSKAINAPIRQNVNVIVQNKSSSIGIKQSKRLINREVLLN